MLYHAIEREKVGDRPCWQRCRTVLPDLQIEVSTELQKFVARLMVPSGGQSYHWIETAPMGLTDLARLFIDWHDDPEGALWTYWKETAPDSALWVEGRHPAQRAGRVVTKVLIPVGDVNVDDLDGL